jgi:uncharacterized protein (DUF302 family)
MSDANDGAPETQRDRTSGVITTLSPRSVADTVERLTEVLATKGVKLFAIIDQSAEAAAVGLKLRDTRLAIFGNPKGGTPVMDALPLVALDLPLRVVIWDDDSQTRVSYTDPSELAGRYGIPEGLAAPLGAVSAIVREVVAA